MPPTSTDTQPFRLLDLPPELRQLIYEQVEFPTTWHVLERTEALPVSKHWPEPPQAQLRDSRVTLTRPHALAPLNLMTTCRQVHQEFSSSISGRKMNHLRVQPVRYLVDYSAAYALLGNQAGLGLCIGMPYGGRSLNNKAMTGFVELCTHHLDRMRQVQPGGKSVRYIEMTITVKEDVVYGSEVWQTMFQLHLLRNNYLYSGPNRLVVVYRSPLPRTMVPGGKTIRDSDNIEEVMGHTMQKDTTTDGSEPLQRGTFLRPLGHEAFEKHVEALECC